MLTSVGLENEHNLILEWIVLKLLYLLLLTQYNFSNIFKVLLR